MNSKTKYKVRIETLDQATKIDRYGTRYGKWNWPILNAEIDLFQEVESWARDLAIGVVWLINPFHWDDAIEGVGYSVTHISEVVPAIMDEVKTTYEEQGLVYCVGYVIPEVLAYFYGAGEAKAVSNLEKVDDITKLGKYADDALDVERIADNTEDLAKAYPELQIPKGYEDYHTGRIKFENNINGITEADEKLSMEEIMSNPCIGEEIISKLNDPNLPPPPNEWAKMQYVHETPNGNITIHFDYNATTGEYIDFKIINP